MANDRQMELDDGFLAAAEQARRALVMLDNLVDRYQQAADDEGIADWAKLESYQVEPSEVEQIAELLERSADRVMWCSLVVTAAISTGNETNAEA